MRGGRAGVGAVGAAALVVGVGLASALGCSKPRTPFNDPDALVVATYSDFTEQLVAATAPWQAEHPEVRLSLAPYGMSDFGQAMIPRLLTGSDLPDVMVVDAGFVARAGAGKLFEDLSAAPYSAEPLVAGLPASVVAQAHAGGALRAVPADVAPAILYYRKDVLDQAGVAEAELSRSWESFVTACGKIQAATRTFCVPRAADLAEAVVRAETPAGQSPWFSASGEPLGDEARYVHAFAVARAAEQARIVEGTAVPGTERWMDLVRRGYLVVVIGGPTTVRRLEALTPGAMGRWRAAPLPGGGRFAVTSAFCAVTAGGARKARAWEYVRRVCATKDAQLEAWIVGRALPSLPAAAGARALEQPVSFLGGQVVGPAWREEAKALPVPGATAQDAFARDAVMLELDYVLEDGKDVSAALAEARGRIRRVVEHGRGRSQPVPE